MNSSIRILLVGDQGVGKTSIILTLLSEEFPESVPSKCEEIIIPPNVTPENVPTYIVDFSATEQNIEELYDEILKSDVVCVVYSVENVYTVDRLTNYWLPLIRKASDVKKPVLLVGNKSDLVDFSTIDDMLAIMDDFPEVESCIECSAKILHNITEMFCYAQKAVLHPTAPLYKIEEQELTVNCKQALARIFKICDMDNDGLLNDYEMNNFQRRCFEAPFQHQVIDELKTVLMLNFENGIINNCFTLTGFYCLHLLFVQRGRTETFWAVLRKFGYDNNLNMSKAYTHPILEIPPEATVELSQSGHQFLTALFNRSDRDGDMALSPKEYKAVFSACPRLPWTSNLMRSVPATQNGYLSYRSWMCLWNLMIIVDCIKTMEYLAYLGFNFHQEQSQLFAINVTKKETKITLNCEKQSNKSVFKCNVFGSKGSGKTALCRGLITQEMKTLADKDFRSNITHCISTVQLYDHERYIVLQDINVDPIFDTLEPDQMDCDVACLVYDSNNAKSFEYIAKMYVKYFSESSCPILIVGTKHDLRGTFQDYILQPHDFCDKYQLIPPQHFSVKENCKELYSKLTTMAAFRPLKQNWKSHVPRKHHDTFFGLNGLGIAAATIIGFIFLKSVISMS